MRTALVLLVAFLVSPHASAAPRLIRVAPDRGVTFMRTTVQIHGVELPPGSARVFFGQLEAVVSRYPAGDDRRAAEVNCWLLVVGCWLLVVGCWLLVAGCWLLVVGWLAVDDWLSVVGCLRGMA